MTLQAIAACRARRRVLLDLQDETGCELSPAEWRALWRLTDLRMSFE